MRFGGLYGLVQRAGGEAGGLFQLQLVEQLLEAFAVFGQVDGVRRGAEDRHAGVAQRYGQLQRRLPAELHDDAGKHALRLLGVDDFQHVFAGERLEIEPVGGVVIGRHGFRIAVDHDGFETLRRQRESRMAAAIVEFDALADAVWSAAENDDFLLVGGFRFAFGVRRRWMPHRSNTYKG